MQLSSIRKVPASVEDTYVALTDAQFLKDCIPGCESIENAGEERYLVTLAAKVGPVSARFNGSMTIVNSQPPRVYSLVFEGKGGPAGFAKGSAEVLLVQGDAGDTDMSYTVRADVGGKLAQVGARLIEGAAKKVADEFFDAFIEKMQARPQAAAASEPPRAAAAGARSLATGLGFASSSTGWKLAVLAAGVLILGWIAWSLR